MAEAEARVLSSATLTRVFAHIYLRDPSTDLDSLFEPMSGEGATIRQGKDCDLTKRSSCFTG